MLFLFSLAAVFSAAPSLDPGTQLHYTGTMVPLKDDGGLVSKTFEVTYVVLSAGDQLQGAWTLNETGRGGFGWLDRFGSAPLAGDGHGELGPALLYVRDEGHAIVPLAPPLFTAPVALERGATWEVDRLEHRVTGETTKAGRACFQVEVRSPYGYKRTVWVEGGGLVVAVREAVFIGQGEEHRLTWELSDARRLRSEELAAVTDGLAAWLKLREQLAWRSRNPRTELSDAQLATLKAGLPEVSRHSTGPLAPIATAAQRDAQGQRNRAGAVSALRGLAVGRPLGEIPLSDLSGRNVSPADLQGKVIVLHFWEYRDTPLEEPYGQTGYLDYVARRRGADGVRVLGVNVDGRLADNDTRRAAINSARKLQQFMNLSYPILLDDGSLLKRVGDPRPGGGKLPLFVVVGKDGKIAEYHAGLYDVKANEGLGDLNTAVGKALSEMP